MDSETIDEEEFSMLADLAAFALVPVTEIIAVYLRIKNQDRMYVMDLIRLQSFGLPVLTQLASDLKRSPEHTQDMVSAGWIGFKQVKNVLEHLAIAVNSNGCSTQ